MASEPLPQEIILLLCEELAARRDFDTLFQCSLSSRRVARIALEKLYSIQDFSLVSTGETHNGLKWSRLWRSIILSSTGSATAYPYCVYVRLLSFGNFEECLYDMLRDPGLRDSFFEGPMQQLLGLQNPIGVLQLTPRDRKAIMVKCADSITAYIKRFADETETTAALAHLEGVYFPHDLLPNWISRLGNLTSLRIRDGSVLGVEAAKAISECCPHFVDLTCYYYHSSNADEDLAAFFQTLRPNSLQSFEIISQNGIGEQALTALNAHATSLRSLILGSLPPQGIMALSSLASCTALEVLSIENDAHNLRSMADMEEVLREVSAWISSCKSLRHLSFYHFLSILPVVKDVLGAPDIRLQSLSIVDFLYHDPGEATWVALGTQDRLESLTIGLHNRSIDGFSVRQGSLLADSILKLKSLTTLNLIMASIDLSTVQHLPEALPNLVEFSFSGDNVDDSILGPLSNLPQLKLLSINAPSSFSYSGLFDFVQKLAATPDREGIRIDILNQHGYPFDQEENDILRDFMADELKGRIDITYTNHPDDLHEEDFTDFSD
ncbi:hypothetical protein F4820DRAFT_441459 [Hypoxylon rubiginosum]|uniref:Uncharacterized protein n=1 Tax=Hypoxylon rubiginosum TaxID=110542 RepID=A0ACB9YHQ9_9PEZI|nr:hypothetical protein F4820DRAFT_441459 [Hypoxylon rubiginosum]